MRKEGVELIEHIKNLSIVGIWEVIKNLSKIRSHYKNILKNVEKRKPDMAILVDYPGFNLRLAKLLKKKNIPVVYYIIPQVWAWGKHRIKALKNYTDKTIVLFKFEEELLRKHGLNCTFAGHPLIDKIPPQDQTAEVPDQKGPTIAFLPGSRNSEVKDLFPIMLSTTEKITEVFPRSRFLVAESSNVEPALYASKNKDRSSQNIIHIKDNTAKILAQSDFAIVASGTATLETALANVPMVLTYKVHPITYPLIRSLLRLPFIGLVNIVAGKEIVPEFLQKKACPSKIANKIIEILKDKDLQKNMKDGFASVRTSLGGSGASKKAARCVYDFLKQI